MPKLNAESVYGDSPKLKEPKLIDDWVLWLEQRSYESGRTTLLIRNWGQTDCCPLELTPAPFNIRTRIHGYGGGAFAVERFQDQLILVWVDDSTGCLWKQSWIICNNLLEKNLVNLKEYSPPTCISIAGEFLLGDGLIDIKRMQWLGLMEYKEKDFIVTFSLFKEFQEPNIIYEANSFLGYFDLSPDGNRLAWLEWQKKYMPWDRSELWIGYLSEKSKLISYNIIAGNQSNENISIFQPIWFSDQKLLFSQDVTGWWNINYIDLDISNNRIISRDNLYNINAEFALPQWVAGMSTIAISDDRIVALSCYESKWKLNIISLTGDIKIIDIPFDDLSYLEASKGRAIIIASNSIEEPTLIEIDLIKETYKKQKIKNNLVLKIEELSIAESIWFKGSNQNLTHAWYYSPSCSSSKKTPLLVRIHSGPTSMSSRSLDFYIQFWTSRGWSVLDVNYAGSTGFGKKYRDRLKGGWGYVDALDCISAVKELISLGNVDQDLIAIEGSSAGGLTTLACLTMSKIFKVAACKYPVTDLLDMHNNTHRFESGYLDYLLGNLPENEDKYFYRSPINNINKINTPLILFHGVKDNVVTIDQSKRIYNALNEKLVPVELYDFNNEGHGFKDRNVSIKVLKLKESFFYRHLGIRF